MGRDSHQRRRRGHAEDNVPWEDYPDDSDRYYAFGYQRSMWEDENEDDWRPGMSGYGFQFSTRELLEERLAFSPDFHKIRLQKRVPLFVFDHMKYNGARHKLLLKNAIYHGTAHTIQKDFRVYQPEKRKLEALAFTVNSENDTVKAAIRGELWSVSPEHILDIDEYMRNTIAVQRVKKMVVLEEQEIYHTNRGMKIKGRPVEKAFMYIAKPAYWSSSVGGTLRSQVRYTYTSENMPESARDRPFYDIDVANYGRYTTDDVY